MKQPDRDDASRCRYCGEKLSLIQRLSRAEFCNARHKESYQRDQDQLAISRIQQLVIEEREAELQSRINAQPEGSWPEEENEAAGEEAVVAAAPQPVAVKKAEPVRQADGQRLCGAVFAESLAAVGRFQPRPIDQNAEELSPGYRVPEFENNPQAPRLEPAGRHEFRHRVDSRLGDQAGKHPECPTEPPEAGVRYPDLRVEAEDWRQALQRLRESYAGIPPLAGLIQIAGPQTLRFEARIKSPAAQPEQPLAKPVRSYKPGLARGAGIPGMAGAIRGLGTWRTRFGSEGQMIPLWESNLVEMTVAADWTPRYPVFYSTSPWDGEGFEAAFGLGPGLGAGNGGDGAGGGPARAERANVTEVLASIPAPLAAGEATSAGTPAAQGHALAGAAEAGDARTAASSLPVGEYRAQANAGAPATAGASSGTASSSPNSPNGGASRLAGNHEQSGARWSSNKPPRPAGAAGASDPAASAAPDGFMSAEVLAATQGFGARAVNNSTTVLGIGRGRGQGNGWGEGTGTGTGDGRGSVSVDALAALVKAARQSDRSRAPLRDLEIPIASLPPAAASMAEPKPWRGLLEGSARDLPSWGPCWRKSTFELRTQAMEARSERMSEDPAPAAPPDCMLPVRNAAKPAPPALRLAPTHDWPEGWLEPSQFEAQRRTPAAWPVRLPALLSIPAAPAPPVEYGRASRLQPALRLPEPWVRIQERDQVPAPVAAQPSRPAAETRRPARPDPAGGAGGRLSFGRIERPGGQWVLMRGSGETATFRLALDHLGPQEAASAADGGGRGAAALGPVARYTPAPGRAAIPPARGIVYRDLVLERDPVEPSLEPVVCQFGSVRGGVWQSRT